MLGIVLCSIFSRVKHEIRVQSKSEVRESRKVVLEVRTIPLSKGKARG